MLSESIHRSFQCEHLVAWFMWSVGCCYASSPKSFSNRHRYVHFSSPRKTHHKMPSTHMGTHLSSSRRTNQEKWGPIWVLREGHTIKRNPHKWWPIWVLRKRHTKRSHSHQWWPIWVLREGHTIKSNPHKWWPIRVFLQRGFHKNRDLLEVFWKVHDKHILHTNGDLFWIICDGYVTNNTPQESWPIWGLRDGHSTKLSTKTVTHLSSLRRTRHVIFG